MVGARLGEEGSKGAAGGVMVTGWEDRGRRAESERREGVEPVEEAGDVVRWASRREMSDGIRERGDEDDMARALSLW